MEDIACPRCKTTKYRNPSLKLLVNVCGHGLCENCVELLFVKGSGACPQCGIPLRRSNFRLQIFEDASVEKEVDIRRKILKDFNKKEEDFSTLREYNDYLEEVETIIFNLANNIDVEATKRKIEQYKKENKNIIMKNKGKLSREEEMLEELIEQEKQLEEFRRHQVLEEETETKKAKMKKKEALIDDLMFSDLPAKQIMATHASIPAQTETTKQFKPAPTIQFSTGIKMGKQEVFLPVPKQSDEDLYSYSRPELELLGPNAPTFTELQTSGFLQHVRNPNESEKAGGFVPNYACYRALQEAFSGLYFATQAH